MFQIQNKTVPTVASYSFGFTLKLKYYLCALCSCFRLWQRAAT